MSETRYQTTLSASWQTRFFTSAISMSEPQKGICEIDSDSISLRAGRQSQEIKFTDITYITVDSPPSDFSDEFDKVFGIKFTQSGNSQMCLLDYDTDRVELFDHQLSAEIINGARGVVEFGAKKGGQRINTSSNRVEVAIKPDGVVFKQPSDGIIEISLGDIVNIQTGSRTVGDSKKDVIKVDHMDHKTRVTSYVSLVESRTQHLLNVYMRKEYARLQTEISEIDISEIETQLIIGYYTTQSITQTMETLTDGDKHEFESIYEQALNHGLVTHPDEGIGLTQMGKMLANTELESVNS